MKFRVHLGWQDDYLFDSADEAVRFAITAKVKREDQQPNGIRIRIELLSESDLEAERREKEADND